MVLLAAVLVVLSSSIAAHARVTTPTVSTGAITDPGTGTASISLSLSDGTIKSTDDSADATPTRVAQVAADRQVDNAITLTSTNDQAGTQASAVDGPPLISSRQDGSSLPTVAVAAPITSYFSSSGAPVSTEGATLTWKLTRTGDTGSELTVPLKWSHSTGSGGPYANFFVFTEDNPKVESVTFGVGVSEVTLSVDTVDDSVFELNSVLRICPSNDTDDGYGVTYESNWWNCAGFHIQDNDASQAPLVTIAASTASATEGDVLIFTLELSYALNFDVRVAMRSSAAHKDRSIPPRGVRVVKTLRAGSTACLGRLGIAEQQPDICGGQLYTAVEDS